MGATSSVFHSSMPLATQISEQILLPADKHTLPFPRGTTQSPMQLPHPAQIPAASPGPNTALMFKFSPHLTHSIYNGRIGKDNCTYF